MNALRLMLLLFAPVLAESDAAEMSDSEYEEMFNELDENSDGKLTLTEVMDSLQSELEEEFGDDVPTKLKELLTTADADNNEELSKDELLSFVEKTQEYLESLELAGGEDDDEMDMPDDEEM